jgi:hypothetical protein
MAVYNEILSGRFNRALQKVFGIKGPPAVPQLAGEITAALPMFWGAEARYLEGWNRFGVLANIAAGGAGNRAAMRFRNPVASGMVAVIEKITIASNLLDQPFVTIGAATDLGIVSTVNTGWDNRGSPTPMMIVSSSGNAGAILGVSAWQAIAAANSTVDVIQTDIQEIALLPQTTTALGNGAITVYCNVLNQAFTASIWWRERVLEDSEKT